MALVMPALTAAGSLLADAFTHSRSIHVEVKLPEGVRIQNKVAEHLDSGPCAKYVQDPGSNIVSICFANNGSFSSSIQLKMSNDKYLTVGASNPLCGCNKTRVDCGTTKTDCKRLWKDMNDWGECERGVQKGSKADVYDNPSYFCYETVLTAAEVSAENDKKRKQAEQEYAEKSKRQKTAHDAELKRKDDLAEQLRSNAQNERTAAEEVKKKAKEREEQAKRAAEGAERKVKETEKKAKEAAHQAEERLKEAIASFNRQFAEAEKQKERELAEAKVKAKDDAEKEKYLVQTSAKAFVEQQKILWEGFTSRIEETVGDVAQTIKPSIAVLGLNGVGKSSICNALAGKKVAKTGSKDTTKVFQKIAESDSVEVHDVPGECFERSYAELEYLMKSKTMHFILVVYIDRVSHCIGLAKLVKSCKVPFAIVRNKIDASADPSDWEDEINKATGKLFQTAEEYLLQIYDDELKEMRDANVEAPLVFMSSKTREGIGELKQMIFDSTRMNFSNLEKA